MIARTIAAQWSRPAGMLGRLVAAVMNRSNAAMNRRAIALLELEPRHHVLDIGFGGGVSITPLLARTASGRVFGIEPSPLMLGRAAARHREAIADGRLRLSEGTAETLPYAARAMDRILSVNTLYFWDDPGAALREVRRILRPDGRLVLAYRPAASMRASSMTKHGFHLRDDEEVLDLLGDAGFEALAMETRHDDGVGYCCVVAAPWDAAAQGRAEGISAPTPSLAGR
jgi:SAM-dependent methyltransferase